MQDERGMFGEEELIEIDKWDKKWETKHFSGLNRS